MRKLRASLCEILDLVSAHPRSPRELAEILHRSPHCVRTSLQLLKDRGLAWPSGNLALKLRVGQFAYKWTGVPAPRPYERTVMINQSHLVNLSRDLLVWLRERRVYITSVHEEGLAPSEVPPLFLVSQGAGVTTPVQIPSDPEKYASEILGRSEWVLQTDTTAVREGDRVVILIREGNTREEVIAGEGVLGTMLVGETTRTLSSTLLTRRGGGEVLVYRAKHVLRS